MATHSSTLALKIPWTEEPGRLQSMGSLRVRHNWATSLSLFTFLHWRRKWQPTPVFLPGESQGQGRLVGCCLWGRTGSHEWSDLAAAAWQHTSSSRVMILSDNKMGAITGGYENNKIVLFPYKNPKYILNLPWFVTCTPWWYDPMESRSKQNNDTKDKQNKKVSV